MAIRNWIGNLKSLQRGRWQWDCFRSMSTLLPNTALPSDGRANSTPNFASQGALTHAHSAKVKFLGVFVGFVDQAKRKRQADKALEKRRRVIHRLRQFQKQRQESWNKQVERLAFDAFTRAYRKTLNTLKSGSKAKQAIFDKASELGTKAALTLTDQHPLITTDDLKKLLQQEEDHFGRLGWEYLPVSVKTAYESLMLSIEDACEDLKAQIAAESRSANLAANTSFASTESTSNNMRMESSDHVSLVQPECDYDVSDLYENVMERLADAEALCNAYHRIKGKLQGLSGKSDEDWSDLSMSFFDQMAYKLRSGTYQFSPVSKILVRKPGREGTSRTILVVNPKDQVVVEAVRAELERMYEPVFYKLARSCHMALKLVKSTWKGTTWFLHYKSPIVFKKLQHENLLHILSLRVKDAEFLDLLQQMFKVSVVSLGDHGSRLSALLCNVYYHQLDMEVTHIQAELNAGSNKRKTRARDEESEALATVYARVRYVRYGEEFLFGVTGSKAMAMEVSDRVQTFLRSCMGLVRLPDARHWEKMESFYIRGV